MKVHDYKNAEERYIESILTFERSISICQMDAYGGLNEYGSCGRTEYLILRNI